MGVGLVLGCHERSPWSVARGFWGRPFPCTELLLLVLCLVRTSEKRAPSKQYPHAYQNHYIREIEDTRPQIAHTYIHKINNCSTIDWQFTSEHARIKLRRLYPSISS